MYVVVSFLKCRGPRRRAGDVIPQVLGLAQPLPGSERGRGDGNGSAFVFPTACPACGTTVVKEEVGDVVCGHGGFASKRGVEGWENGKCRRDTAAFSVKIHDRRKRMWCHPDRSFSYVW